MKGVLDWEKFSELADLSHTDDYSFVTFKLVNQKCDEKIPRQLYGNGLRLIDEMSTLGFTRIKNHYLKPKEQKVHKANFFRSGEYRLFAVRFGDEFGEVECIGMFHLPSHRQVLLGTIVGHAFVITPEFVYDNSWGGPTKDIKMRNVKQIFHEARKYYLEFCNDQWR